MLSPLSSKVLVSLGLAGGLVTSLALATPASAATTHLPHGKVLSVSRSANKVTLTGGAWRTGLTSRQTVRVTVSGKTVSSVLSNRYNSKLSPRRGEGHTGHSYGFVAHITVPVGKHHVCLYTAYRHHYFHCEYITVPKPPVYAPVTTAAQAMTSTSHYLRKLTGQPGELLTVKALGAHDAPANPSGHRYLSLLDIGGQSGGGVVLSATSHFLSYPALVQRVDAYIDGYVSTRNASAPMTFALGTNNDMDVSSATGKIWAQQVVNPVRSYASRYSNVAVVGADDMEPGFRATAAQTKAWLSGYLSATTASFVFNGSADGCPLYAVGGNCNNHWTASDLAWLSGLASPSRVSSLPQIYNTAMPLQWHNISALAARSGAKVKFAGVLTEYTACAQAHNSCYSMGSRPAWQGLFNALASDPATRQSSLTYATDLQIF